MHIVLKKTITILVSVMLATMPMQLLAADNSSQKTQHSTAKKRVVVKKSTAARLKYNRIKAQRLARERAMQLGENYDGASALRLASEKALVINQNTGEVVYAKNTNITSPIASITKLMTAMVMLDAGQPLDEVIYISDQDVDYVKYTHSRLAVGLGLPRGEMLQLALMSSENRAASALASNYVGGQAAFVKAMNAKALSLGLFNTHFDDPTGLESSNVSTAEDLVKMVEAAYQYPEIREATTSSSREVYLEGRNNPLNFNNTNGLVRAGQWEIGLSKTGFINEAGRCLVMQAMIGGEPMIMVLLDSNGKFTRIGDANRVRKWVEHNMPNPGVAEEPGTINGAIENDRNGSTKGAVS